MLPTDILKNEHRVIEQVLNVVERIVRRIEVEGTFDTESAGQAIDFLRNFADRCHHGKEEHQLFPMLEIKGFDRDNGPTGVMCAEHEEGRALIQGMADAVAEGNDPAAGARYATFARAYVDMLRMHIQKEDHCLFSMADRALSDGDQTALMDLFEKVEAEDMGSGTHEKYLELANGLADRYGVARAEIACDGHGPAFACTHGHGHS